MNNQDGQVLTPSVAQELIVELFAGATVQKQEIVRAVDEAHTERGGQAPTAFYVVRGSHTQYAVLMNIWNLPVSNSIASNSILMNMIKL